jgi:uncharacterized protein DUF4328
VSFEGPTYPTPPPPDHSALGRSLFIREPKPIGGVGIAAAVLIAIATVLSAVETWSDWHRYHLAVDYLSGTRQVSYDELDSADNIAQATIWIAIAGLTAAGVVFLVWLWRARQNAENLCMAHHRRSQGWVIGSWICPVVNFWFPYMIMDDVYRASRPDNPPDLMYLRDVRGSAALGWWWGLWVTMWVTDRIAAVTARGDVIVETLRSIAVFDTVGTLAMTGAAVLIIRIMREISAWQATRWPN